MNAICIYHQNLLSMHEIKNAILIFTLKEMENLQEGLPFDVDILTNLLWKVDRTISKEVLKVWMNKC